MCALGDDRECLLRDQLLGQPNACRNTHTHAQTVTRLSKLTMHGSLSNSFYQYLHSLFLSKMQLIIYGWKENFLRFTIKLYQFDISDGFQTAGRNIREIVRIIGYCTFNSIFIMLFHVLGQV